MTDTNPPADRTAEIRARLAAATEGPWEQGAALLLGEVMFTDDLRETVPDRATKCCYCTKCGPILWEGMTELFGKTVKAHRHRSPTTPVAFAEDMVMGANARIIVSEIRKPADTALIANAPADLAYLLARVEELERQHAKAMAFIDERAQFIQILRNYRGEDNGDYIRWQGHAEARRVLAESMGIELDKEKGGIRKPAEKPSDEH